MLQKVFVADLDTGRLRPAGQQPPPARVTAPRFTSERMSSLLGKAVHGALAVIHLRWSARSPGRRAFAPGIAGHTAPLPQAGRGEPRCRRGTLYLCDIRVRDVARRAG